MTNEKTLDDKVREACHRIEELWNETDGKCYVSFSGGKDSTVLLALIKMCQELYTVGEIPAVFSNTGIELGVTVDFVKWVKDNWYPYIEIIRPNHSFSWVLENKGKPILSKIKSEYLHRWHSGNKTGNTIQSLVTGITPRGKPARNSKLADKYAHMLHEEFPINLSSDCCKVLKKKPFLEFEKRADMKGAIIGIRVEEGGPRFTQAMSRVEKGGKLCTYTKGSMVYKAPIIDWSGDDLENFISEYNVPLSDAYTKYGFFRTGCMCCPYSRNLANDLEYLYYYEPNRYKAAMHWLKDVYIAQNVQLPFDEEYEREREREWRIRYEPMRQEMLRKYRPNSRLLKDGEQATIFDYLEEDADD